MTNTYELTNIKSLLNKGFTLGELRDFIFYTTEFRPVYEELPHTTVTKRQIIQIIIEHTERHGLFNVLLDWAKRENLYAYEQNRPYLISPTPPAPPTDTTTTRTKELITELTRRLHTLKIQAAQFGISTPPEVTLEIENLERQIDDLQQSLE